MTARMSTRMFPRLLLLFVVFGVASVPVRAEQDHQALLDRIDIPYDRFVLENGLRVIVHTDRKAPVIHVGVWYHVGSKDEPEGRSGFAHYFEHLMFNGSENFDDDFFSGFSDVGATGVNGNTTFDRTIYYETVPTAALERALWLESDRMGYLMGAVDDAKMEEQRGVVQNEKRQGQNNPLGEVQGYQLRGMFPVGHPYRHRTIGSMVDLEAATVKDAKEWFEQYYGAANAVLILSGDVDIETARKLVTRYFGDIAPGPDLVRLKSAVYSPAENTVEVMQSQATATEIVRYWSVPPRDTYEAVLLGLAMQSMAGSQDSPMQQKMVDQEHVATTVRGMVQPYELTSILSINLTLGNPRDEVRAIELLDEVIEDYISNGPDPQQLEQLKTQILIQTLRGLESVGGKGSTLAQGELYSADPEMYKTRLQWIIDATPEDLRAVTEKWLGRGYYHLNVRPKRDYHAIESDLVRSEMPAVEKMAPLTLPEFQQAQLANGLRVVLAERDTIPMISMTMLIDAGTVAESGYPPGVARFTSQMLMESTSSRSGEQLRNTLNSMGSSIRVSADLDWLSVNATMLQTNLNPTLDVLADILMNPDFESENMERVRRRKLGELEQMAVSPTYMAMNTLMTELYGADHPYATPFQGAGTAENVAAITADDMRTYQRAWIRPDIATLFVVGDTTLDELIPALELAFDGWQTVAATVAVKAGLPDISIPERAKVILIDRPGSVQATITAAHVVPSKKAPAGFGIGVANGIFGGQFTARLNMNLREDKGWSYGARASVRSVRGMRPWIISAPVQMDKAVDSVAEIINELNAYLGDNPATEEELSDLSKVAIGRLPARFQTAGAVLASLVRNTRSDLPLDYDLTLADRYQALTLDTVREIAREYMRIDGLTWVIVGDVDSMEEGIRALDLGALEIRHETDSGKN